MPSLLRRSNAVLIQSSRLALVDSLGLLLLRLLGFAVVVFGLAEISLVSNLPLVFGLLIYGFYV